MTSIEELQAELLEMKAKMEEQSATIEEQKNQLEKTKSDLDSAREINSKLWKGTIIPEDKQPQESEHVETMEEFIDSFVKDAVDRIRRQTGDDYIGYSN